jgi:hypothetical protein
MPLQQVNWTHRLKQRLRDSKQDSNADALAKITKYRMRIREFASKPPKQPRTPEQMRVDSLKTAVDNARRTLEVERERQRQQREAERQRKARQRLASISS